MSKQQGSKSAKHPGGAPRTRSPKRISAKMLHEIDAMAEAQCKDACIAEALGFEVTTFKVQFSQRCRQKRAQGKQKLYQRQYEKGLAGDVTMLIWLGKQHLEQADKREINGNVNITLNDAAVALRVARGAAAGRISDDVPALSRN